MINALNAVVTSTMHTGGAYSAPRIAAYLRVYLQKSARRTSVTLVYWLTYLHIQYSCSFTEDHVFLSRKCFTKIVHNRIVKNYTDLWAYMFVYLPL